MGGICDRGCVDLDSANALGVAGYAAPSPAEALSRWRAASAGNLDHTGWSGTTFAGLIRPRVPYQQRRRASWGSMGSRSGGSRANHPAVPGSAARRAAMAAAR